MGNVLMPGAGGGGVRSDDVTAPKSMVLEGYNTLTTDSNDEVVGGTMPNLNNRATITHTKENKTPVVVGTYAYLNANSDGVSRMQIQYNATPGYMNSGLLIGIDQAKVADAIGLTGDDLIVGNNMLGVPGAIPNHAKKPTPIQYTRIFNGRFEVAVERGYYECYWDENSYQYMSYDQIINTMGIASITNFNAALYTSRAILLSWANPTRGLFSGVRIMYKVGGSENYPQNVNDGYVAYEGAGTNIILNNLTADTGHYFRAFPFINTAVGRFYYPGGIEWGKTVTYAVASSIQGQQIFTTSGIFTVPANVRTIQIFCVGGGGGTIQDESNLIGGAGGGYTKTVTANVNPGQEIVVTIGVGGYGTSTASATGGTTYVGGLCSAAGGIPCSYRNGSPGGSGGGGAAWGNDPEPGNGGTNGSSGDTGWNFNSQGVGIQQTNGGAGQGTTTRAFGESSNTLYSGGGAGYGSGSYPVHGGAGGGGGKWQDGGANTGGGAGGMDYAGEGNGISIRRGGSGIAIIRWGY